MGDFIWNRRLSRWRQEFVISLLKSDIRLENGGLEIYCLLPTMPRNFPVEEVQAGSG